MTELSPEAQALLEDARRSHGPSEVDRERVLSTLHASLGIAVPLALASSVAEAAVQAGSPALQTGSPALQAVTSGAQAAGSAQSLGGAGQAGLKLTGKSGWSYAGKLLTWKAGKVLLATVALGSAVGIGVSSQPRAVEQDSGALRTTHAIARPLAREVTAGERGQGSAARAESAAVAAAPAVAQPVVAVQPAAEPTLEAATGVQSPRDTQEPAPAASAVAEPRVKRVAASSQRSTSARSQSRASGRTSTVRTHVHRERVPLAAPEPLVAEPETPAAAALLPAAPPELELIRKAMTSLRDREPGRALALLEEHASRYPNGSFATERRGLHAIALCAAGRIGEGKSEQASFLRQDSETPIAARVRRACVEPTK